MNRTVEIPKSISMTEVILWAHGHDCDVRLKGLNEYTLKPRKVASAKIVPIRELFRFDLPEHEGPGAA